MSADGETILFSEAGEGGGTSYSVYVRNTDGRSPAVRLGEGFALGLSPDGSWAFSSSRTNRSVISLLPTGAGAARHVETDFVLMGVALLRSNAEAALIMGLTEAHGLAIYEQSLDGGPPRPLTPPIVVDPRAGRRRFGAFDISATAFISQGGETPWAVYRFDGAEPRPIEALAASDTPIYLGQDHRYVYFVQNFTPPVDILRLDLDTGAREPWGRVNPPNLAGVGTIGDVLLVAETGAYATSYMRVLSELYLVDGLR